MKISRKQFARPRRLSRCWPRILSSGCAPFSTRHTRCLPRPRTRNQITQPLGRHLLPLPRHQGLGGSFGYDLISQVGKLLCDYNYGAEFTSEWKLKVVEVRRTAIKFIVVRDIQGDGGQVGKQLQTICGASPKRPSDVKFSPAIDAPRSPFRRLHHHC